MKVISYTQLVIKENGKQIQKGMNFAIQKTYSVVLMSTQKNAPYNDHILEDGVNWANSPKECAQEKDLVFMCLPMPGDVEKVALGESKSKDFPNSNSYPSNSASSCI